MAVQVAKTPRAAAEFEKLTTGRRAGLVTSAGDDWIDPLNVEGNDGLSASVSLAAGGTSSDIFIQNFGFNVPSNAIIHQLNFYAKGNTNTSFSIPEVQLVSGGADFGDPIRLTAFNTIDDTEEETILGRELGLTAGQLNTGNFGLKFRVEGSGSSATTTFVDTIEIEVIYYVPSSGHWISDLSPSTVTTALATNNGPDGNVTSGTTSIFSKWPNGLVPGDHIHPLRVTDLGFALPADAIIEGIQVKVGAEATMPVQDFEVFLVYQGQIWSHNLGLNTDIGSTVGTGAPVRTYGNFTHKWGRLRAWDADDINDPSFGVELRYLVGNNAGGSPAQVKVDWVEVTISYFVPVAIAGSLSGTLAIAAPALRPNRGLRGTLGASAALSAPALPVLHTLTGTVNVLASMMATELHGGIAFVTQIEGPTAAEILETGQGRITGLNRLLKGDPGRFTWLGTGTHVSSTVALDVFDYSVPSQATVEGTLKVHFDIEDMFGLAFIEFVKVRLNDSVTSAQSDGFHRIDAIGRHIKTIEIPLGSLPVNPADANAAGFGIEFRLLNFIGDYEVRIYDVKMELVYHLPATFRLEGTPITGTLTAQHSLPPVALSQGPLFPTQGQNETFSGVPWNSISGALGGPGTATCGPLSSPQSTDRLNLSAFSFTAPALAEIIGITVEIRVRSSISSSTGLLCDRQIFLVKQGARVGVNKAVAGLNLPGTEGAIGTNFERRTYTWSKSEVQSLGITKDIVNSTTPMDLGVSIQYATKSGAAGTPTVQVDWAQMTVFWSTVSGTVSATFALNSPAITRPVALGIVPLSFLATITGDKLKLNHTLNGGLSAAAELDGVLGLPHVLNGTLTGTLAPNTPTLRIGIDRFLFGGLLATLDVDDATLLTDYRFHGTITGITFLGADELEVITSATGSSFRKRMLDVMPPWFGDEHPVLDSILDGVSSAWLHVFELIRFAGFQTRIRTATDGWLDLIAGDFFGNRFPRKESEPDNKYRQRFINEIFRERGTRAALQKVLFDLTGRNDHLIIEPQRPLDTGVYGLRFIGNGDTVTSHCPEAFTRWYESIILGETFKVEWTDPGNSVALDGNHANTALNAGQTSRYLVHVGFPAQPPRYAEMVGIQVRVRAKVNTAGSTLSIHPVVKGVIQAAIATHTLTTSYVEYVTDALSSFTLEDLLHPDSGFAVRATNPSGEESHAQVDSVLVEIQYRSPESYNVYGLGYGVAGIYGSMLMDHQVFIRAKLPQLPGIAFVGGYGIPVFGYAIPSQGVWAKSSDAEGPITDDDVFKAIDSVAPAGTIMWTNISV